MQVGLGGVMATMNASTEAAQSGIGGWFDGVTYMAGLSGGSWGTGTFMANGGQLPTDLVNNVWDLSSNLILPDDGKLSFYYDLVSEVDSKSSEGFPTQITDYWALALGNHLLPTQYRLNTSPNFTMSELPSKITALGNASLPMPIIIAANGRQGKLSLPRMRQFGSSPLTNSGLGLSEPIPKLEALSPHSSTSEVNSTTDNPMGHVIKGSTNYHLSWAQVPPSSTVVSSN